MCGAFFLCISVDWYMMLSINGVSWKVCLGEDMKIENKEMLLYSMNKAIEEARKAMEDTDKNEKEVYYRVGSALHWIVDCFDRVCEVKIKISPKDEDYRMALHAANNALKHRPELLKLHKKTGGTRLPMRFPCHFLAIYYVWDSIDTVPLNIPKQKKSYKSLLEGKGIRLTFEATKNITETYCKQDI